MTQRQNQSKAREAARKQRLREKLRPLSLRDREPYQERERDRLHATVLGVKLMGGFFHFTRANLFDIVSETGDTFGVDRRREFRTISRAVLASYGAKSLDEVNGNHVDEVALIFLNQLQGARMARYEAA